MDPNSTVHKTPKKKMKHRTYYVTRETHPELAENMADAHHDHNMSESDNCGRCVKDVIRVDTRPSDRVSPVDSYTDRVSPINFDDTNLSQR